MPKQRLCSQMNMRNKWFQVVKAHWAIFLVVLLAFLILPFYKFFIIDDAFISYRYSYNLYLGKGLVFNQGERVEGITNLLWTIIIAFGFWAKLCSHETVNNFSVILSILFILFSFWRTDCILRKIDVKSFIRFITLFSLLLTNNLWLSLTNGLEGALYSALLIETLYKTITIGNLKLGAIIGGLCFVTRPEGLLAFPSYLFSYLIYLEPQWNSDVGYFSKIKKSLPSLGIFILIISSLSIFRIEYFGAILPNSIMAKRPPNILAVINNLKLAYIYLKSFVSENLLLSLSILLAPIIIFLKRKNKTGMARAHLLAILLVSGGQIAAILVNGGDWMPHFRLLSPYLFLWAILMGMLLTRGAELIGTGRFYLIKMRALSGFLLICIIWFSGSLSKNFIWHWDSSLYKCGFSVSSDAGYYHIENSLSACLNRSDVVSAEALGEIAYRLQHNYFHDFLGLTDKHIATRGPVYHPTFGKSDMDYTIMTVKPTIIILHSKTYHLQSLSEAGKKWFYSNYEIWYIPNDEGLIAIKRSEITRFRFCLLGFKKLDVKFSQ